MKIFTKADFIRIRAQALWDSFCGRKQIKNLANCLYFSLDYAIILFEADGFLLMCKTVDREIFVSHYPTLAEAESGFEKQFLNRRIVSCRPHWTPPYYVFNSWLKKRRKDILSATKIVETNWESN